MVYQPRLLSELLQRFSLIVAVSLVACVLPNAVSTAAQIEPKPNKQREAKVLPERIFLYASRVKPLSTSELAKLAGPAAVKVSKGTSEDWKELTVSWPDSSITIDRKSDREFLPKHLDGFSGYLFQELGEGKMDQQLFHLIRQVNRTSHTYAVRSNAKIKGKQAAFVARLAKSQNSVIFDGIGVLDPNLQILLGPKKEREPLAKLPEYKSAADRKSRTMAQLANRKLTPFAGLPSIVAKEELQARSAQEIAKRCMCLLAVAAHAEDADQIKPIEFLKKHGAWDAASPQEKQFLQNAEPTEKEKSTLTWRYESLTALLWAINKLPKIDFPTRQSDAGDAISAVMEKPETFIASAKLRPAKEILDQADLIYRSFWLVTNARQTSKPIEGLSASVVYERHYALCWLVRYMNKEWDDVTPDS